MSVLLNTNNNILTAIFSPIHRLSTAPFLHNLLEFFVIIYATVKNIRMFKLQNPKSKLEYAMIK